MTRRPYTSSTASAAPTASSARRATFWVTRGSDSGATDVFVRVWIRRPERREAGSLVYWYGEREDGVGAYWCTWTLDECARLVGTVPDDDRQCLRAEGAGLWIPERAA